MIDGSVLQSAQWCFEKKSRVVVKMVVNSPAEKCNAVETSLETEYAFFFNLLLTELLKCIFPLVGIRFS